MKQNRSVRAVAMLAIGLGTSYAMPGMLHGQTYAVQTAPSAVSHDGAGQAGKSVVNLEMSDVPLSSVLDAIARQSGLRVVYNAADPALQQRVSRQMTRLTAAQALRVAVNGTGVSTEMSQDGETILVRAGAAARGKDAVKQGTIVGKVIHAKTKQPVSGARIVFGNGQSSVTTGDDGVFRITVSPGEQQLDVRAVGFTRHARRVTVTEGVAVTVEIALEPTASVLDQVIVTGTVVETERRAIPNPITVITAADIEKRGITRIDQLFRGEVPGVLATDMGVKSYSDDLLGGLVMASVYARGSSGSAGTTPTPLKTFIDGVELVDPLYLGTIDPASIERIEIVTGPQAATVYGSGALGGVMQIFTKKGANRTAPDVMLNLKYGMLESDFSSGKTPSHQHVASLTGGRGAGFSYAANVSYNYTGQWQPSLFARTIGASVGMTYTDGPVTANGSVSATSNKNGTSSVGGEIKRRTLMESGEWAMQDYWGPSRYLVSRLSTAAAQTQSLNLDYRLTSWWQHHFTVGRNQTNFSLEPTAPDWVTPGDTLFRANKLRGERTSLAYNTSLIKQAGALHSTMTLGGNYTFGEQMSVVGCLTTLTATSYVGCGFPEFPQVNTPANDKSWGGFGTWLLGFFDRLYLTLGIRAERHPSYGGEHKVDWTPTNGATYVFEHGDLTVKLLGSYGRATRPPDPSAKIDIWENMPNAEPSTYLSQRGNPGITPEYSRGPQGGVEVYYGNLGMLGLNIYNQNITDLLLLTTVDTIDMFFPGCGCWGNRSTSMWINVSKTRQRGIETRGNLNLGMIGANWTYSWMDSRVTKYPADMKWYFDSGLSFLNLPTHHGSFTLSYAHGGTSVNLVTNWIGAARTRSYQTMLGEAASRSRNPAYVDRRGVSMLSSFTHTKPGYTRADLAVSHRLAPWASATLNVANLANQYDNDDAWGFLTPTLGRRTLLGVSLRYPQR